MIKFWPWKNVRPFQSQWPHGFRGSEALNSDTLISYRSDTMPARPYGRRKLGKQEYEPLIARNELFGFKADQYNIAYMLGLVLACVSNWKGK